MKIRPWEEALHEYVTQVLAPVLSAARAIR